VSPIPVSAPEHTVCGLKRKNNFSDFGTPPKYARSLLSVHDGSFVCREKLRFNRVKASPYITNVLQHGFAALKPELNKLIDKLACELTGIRFKERLRKLGVINLQSLMDFEFYAYVANRAFVSILC
jgi:hypothetical protein